MLEKKTVSLGKKRLPYSLKIHAFDGHDTIAYEGLESLFTVYIPNVLPLVHQHFFTGATLTKKRILFLLSNN